MIEIVNDQWKNTVPMKHTGIEMWRTSVSIPSDLWLGCSLPSTPKAVNTINSSKTIDNLYDIISYNMILT